MLENKGFFFKKSVITNQAADLKYNNKKLSVN